MVGGMVGVLAAGEEGDQVEGGYMMEERGGRHVGGSLGPDAHRASRSRPGCGERCLWA